MAIDHDLGALVVFGSAVASDCVRSETVSFQTPPPGGLPVPMPGNEPILLAIGDIAVTQGSVILPHGRFPLRGAAWTVQDSSQSNESIPAWAIVLAIIFFFLCLLGLLFLLVKERRYSGFITVSVTGQGYHYATQFPPGPESAAWVAHQVNQARAITSQA